MASRTPLVLGTDGRPRQLQSGDALPLSALPAGAAGKVLTGTATDPAYQYPGGDLVAATDGATVTFDLAVSRFQVVTLGGNRTLALSNDADGMRFTLLLKQDGTGSRTATWWSTVSWKDAVTPVLTTTAGKYDWFTFVRISSGVYLGQRALNF